jgi:hypothetical protein
MIRQPRPPPTKRGPWPPPKTIIWVAGRTSERWPPCSGRGELRHAKPAQGSALTWSPSWGGIGRPRLPPPTSRKPHGARRSRGWRQAPKGRTLTSGETRHGASGHRAPERTLSSRLVRPCSLWRVPMASPTSNGPPTSIQRGGVATGVATTHSDRYSAAWTRGTGGSTKDRR